MARMGASPTKTTLEEDQPSTSRAFQNIRSTTPVDLLEESDDGSSTQGSEAAPARSPIFSTPISGLRPTRNRLPCITPRRSSPRKNAHVSYDSSSDDSSEDEIQFVPVEPTTSSLSCAQPFKPFKRSFLGSKRDSFTMEDSTLPNEQDASTSTIANAKTPSMFKDPSESRNVTPQPGPSGLVQLKPLCRKSISRPASVVESLKQAEVNGKEKDASSTSSIKSSASALAAKRKKPAPRGRTVATRPKVPRNESPELCLIPRYLGSYPAGPTSPTPAAAGVEGNRTRVFADFVIQMLRNDERLNPALYNWKVRTITQTLMENEIPDGPRQ